MSQRQDSGDLEMRAGVAGANASFVIFERGGEGNVSGSEPRLVIGEAAP